MNYETAKNTLAAVWPRVAHSRPAEPVATPSPETLPLDLPLTGFQSWKRVVDLAVGIIALILLAPLMVLTAMLIKLTMPGPVLFRQERIGIDRRRADRRQVPSVPLRLERRGRDRRREEKYGRPFSIYKFRTMVIDAENGRPRFADREDPRITTLGKLLRRSRIDEIPQFINVLKGEMSVVGPRPERAYFIERAKKEIPGFQLRLRTKPGITGLAQVRMGYTNTIRGLGRKLTWDLQYIRDVSLLNDVKILVQTVAVVLTGRGAN